MVTLEQDEFGYTVVAEDAPRVGPGAGVKCRITVAGAWLGPVLEFDYEDTGVKVSVCLSVDAARAVAALLTAMADGSHWGAGGRDGS